MGMVKNQHGMTLVELVIALAISGILMVAVYSVFQAQTRGAIAEQTQLQMEQECRAALILMTREIRSAGSDPFRTGIPGIVVATAGEFRFTRDINGDKTYPSDPDGKVDGPNEDIAYSMHNGSLCRQTYRHSPTSNTVTASGWQPIVPNMDALNFVYLDQWGNVISPPMTAPQMKDIRQVQVTIVARSTHKMPAVITAYKDTTSYMNQQGTVIYKPPTNDTSRRIRMTTTVTCRNNGIQLVNPGS